MSIASESLAKLNRLAKWRAVFAGWQLGTRAEADPECQAVRDHREITLLLRAEVTALTHLLIKKGVCTLDELRQIVGEEADELSKAMEERFPGFKATDQGLSIDPVAARETMKGWKP